MSFSRIGGKRQMKGPLSKSAVTKIQTIVVILLVVVILVGGLITFFAQSPMSRSTPSPTPIAAPTPTPIPTVFPDGEGEIIIGVEYVVPGIGDAFSDLRIPAVKPLPGSFSWDKMQKNPNASIDFSFTDKYVKEFQDNGFTQIVFGLRTSSNLLIDPWMIDKEYPKTQAVDPTYYSAFANWVKSLVERYDKDGVNDMPELKYPLKHYEIGVEFSSYQPEPTEVYLKTLELGYKAAHEASDQVIVGHSAFLVTPVFRDNPNPNEYEKAFAENLVGTAGKGLKDIRMILDRPDLFDVLNVHNLGWPYEIEQIVDWLKYETSQRGYSKPIIISDTAPTSFAGLGPATVTEGKNLAVMLPPATEADRSRLAQYFKKLISNDTGYINWLRNFLAGDVVQRVVVAAEQRIGLIDTAFTGDLPGATSAIFQAGAGNSGWGGMVDYQGVQVTGKRPAYYSLQQLQENIRGYESIVRVKTDEDIRLYRVTKQGEEFFIVWYGYEKLYLPEDQLPIKNVEIDVGASKVTIEKMKTSPDILRNSVDIGNGILSLTITPEPLYIFIP
ncbi:MAG TPA: hypothetical protein VGB11_05180 [Candidatus Bathyarchaeia archaeon]|jgi:hypothetical protein